MSLVNGKTILQKAKKYGYAIGAYNFSNLEQLKGILEVSEQKKCDVIVQTSKSAIDYMGIEVISDMVKNLSQNLSIDVCLNLDHGKTFEIAKLCIDNGYTNVMIDASNLPFDENVKLTKQVVDYAHQHGVSVEAELGSLKGIEDEVFSKESLFTNPVEAKQFAELTGIDSLAVSIGTSHGAYKFVGESYLDIERLKQINSLLDIPLVLHGASGVSSELKEKFINSGGKIGNAKGVSDLNLVESVKHGVCKVNVDTDLRLAFTVGIRNALKDATVFDPRKYIKEGMHEMKNVIAEKIDILTQNKKI